MTGRIRQLAFAATVTAALGFGAAQTLAQPARASGPAQVCNDQTCARVCSALGFHGGFCNTGGGCSCYL
ncbi:hypothetical protein [Longimicrobium sp.]|uniref:hypothetical protein n=1 Tax=Longimicrobium sp. TaxID=2029185 RepID=UPI002C6CFFB2|nr:hypothetical protein [Longimicrobium sp.]HSU15322.1 hypothetical protein [Longimicrobium sp.]